MKYNKLVRDKIPQIIERTGKKAIYRILTETEYKKYLEKKLDEELAEFHESKNIEELADMLEALAALAAVYGASYTVLMQICSRKCAERGGFGKRICLVEVEE